MSQPSPEPAGPLHPQELPTSGRKSLPRVCSRLPGLSQVLWDWGHCTASALSVVIVDALGQLLGTFHSVWLGWQVSFQFWWLLRWNPMSVPNSLSTGPKFLLGPLSSPLGDKAWVTTPPSQKPIRHSKAQGMPLALNLDLPATICDGIHSLHPNWFAFGMSSPKSQKATTPSRPP